MADIARRQDQAIPVSTQTLFKDLGDGTHAEVAYVAGGVIATTGSSAITSTHTARNVQGNTVVLTENENRVYALFINDSDTTVYLNLGAAAAVNEGIRLNANGGSYEMSGQAGNLYTGAVNANHGGGAVDKVLLVTEGV